MGFVPAAPIKMYVTAVRSRCCAWAVRSAMAFCCQPDVPPAILAIAPRISRRRAKAGKELSDVDVAGFVTACGIGQRQGSDRSEQDFLAYIFRNVHHAENIRLGGGNVDQEGLAAAVGKRDWDAAKKFISDEVVHAHSMAGTPGMRRQLEAFSKGGLDLPIVLPTGPQEARRRVVRMAREW